MFRKIVLADENVARKLSVQAKAAIQKNRPWKSVIGLEVHAQIASDSKLFSGSGTKFGSAVNTSVSFFDASIPGTLPVLNRKCVELGVKTAIALNCKVNQISMFDRKHYFYADLPAGYQITQQRAALANNGIISFPVIVPGKKSYKKVVRLLQLQLEQDSGKSLHDDVLKRSLVDLNRAGIPLMELVFAPDLETGEEAASLVKELVLILRRLQTCSCKMEEGALRVDANVSIHQEGEPFGVRTEVKNIGSVRSISQAVCYEIKRQLEVIKNGGKIINETRSWNAELNRTVAMRDKEVLQDYRFMPEPNLPPLCLHMNKDEKNNLLLVSVPDILENIPELPNETRKRLVDDFGIQEETAIILVNEPKLLEYFMDIMQSLPKSSAKLATNILLNELLTFCNKSDVKIEDCQLSEMHLVEIIKSLEGDIINLQAVRIIMEKLHQDPTANLATLIKENDLEQITDLEAIETLCKRAMEKQAKAVKQYKNGKSKAMFAIVGEVAKLSEQKANMKAVVKCLEKLLK